MSPPLGKIGNILQFVAVVLSVTLGFREAPAFISIIICGLIFVVAYVFVRLPQMIGIWRSDGIKIGKLFLIQLVLSSGIAAVFYATGYGVSRIFS